jgi:UDP-N-acetylmuramate--alanine ligase
VDRGGGGLATAAPRVHFVGIGGAGMSALARIALDEGMRVSGSDARTSPVLEHLASLGAEVHTGHDAGWLPPDAAEIVVSSAVPPDNPEVAAARSRGLPVLHRSEWLARLMAGGRGIAVAGSHGKSTTTAMVALGLLDAGLDPTVVIGADLPAIGGNARLGRGGYVVAEADESDGSFLRLHPRIAVVTNVDDDHLDHYGSRAAVARAFASFVAALPADGCAVLCADDPDTAALAGAGAARVIRYGLDPAADVRGADVMLQGFGSRFRVVVGGEDHGECALSVPGRHNVANALAAIAVGVALGLDPRRVARSLAPFGGVGRRFEILNPGGDPLVVDDYAHHPTEIAATLAAARSVCRGRLYVAFQPHRYTRTRLLLPAFGPAFQAADRLIVLPIYPAGEPPLPGVDARQIVAAVQAAGGPPAEHCEDFGSAAARLRAWARPGDVVMVMGAGDVRKLGERLAAAPGPAA